MENEIKFIGLHYGFKNQSQILIEEMSELTKALCKYNRSTDIIERTNLWGDIEEEMADVLVMIRQFCEVWVDKETVEAIAKGKIERQLNRIMEETKK